LATKKHTQAARPNVTRAQQAARKRRTIANLPASTRREPSIQAGPPSAVLDAVAAVTASREARASRDAIDA
jgi:hypothetical protein